MNCKVYEINGFLNISVQWNHAVPLVVDTFYSAQDVVTYLNYFPLELQRIFSILLASEEFRDGPSPFTQTIDAVYSHLYVDVGTLFFNQWKRTEYFSYKGVMKDNDDKDISVTIDGSLHLSPLVVYDSTQDILATHLKWSERSATLYDYLW